MDSDDKNNLTREILSSQRLGSFMSFASGLPGNVLPDNPSWVWEQLRFNPWLAHAVYEDIEEKDDKVGSDLDARKENVLAKSRRVIPASSKRQDVKLAEFTDETLEGYFAESAGARLGFDNFLWEALDAVGKGVAIGETLWAEASDRLYIKRVNFKPQHLFSFGDGPLAAYATGIYANPQTGPLRLRPGVMVEGWDTSKPLPEKQFFVHTFRPRHGNRWGSPLLRRIYWLSWFKRAGVKQWLRLLEKGPGTVLSKYPNGAGEDEQAKALLAAQAVNEEPAVAIPEKFAVEILEHVRQNMGQSFIDLVDDFCNNGIARVIRGQTLTSRGSEGGGSRALGEVHERVEGKKTEVDAKSLMLAVNTQLVWPLVLLNHGPVRQPPVWTIEYEASADQELISKYLKNLWEMKIPISRSYVYTTFPGIEPTGDEDVLSPSDLKRDDTHPDGEGENSFAEGQKKKLPGRPSATQSRPLSFRMERFERLRPTTMRRSAK